MTPLWLICLLMVAIALPLVALRKGWLSVRGDFLVLAVYLQIVLYVQVGPLLRYRHSRSLIPSRYLGLTIAVVFLVEILFLLTYRRLTRVPAAEEARWNSEPRFGLSPRGVRLLIWGLVAFSLAFWAVAAAHNLVYRRLGIGLAGEQLKLPILEFATYRLYIEGLRFVICVAVVVALLGWRQITWVERLGLALIGLSAYMYLVVNSRLDLGLDLLMALGLWAFLYRRKEGFWPRLVGYSMAAVLLLLYSNSTTEKIRVAYGQTYSLSWRAFVPWLTIEEEVKAAELSEASPGEAGFSSTKGAGGPARKGGSVSWRLPRSVGSVLLYRRREETPVAMRLDGLDLIEQMRLGIERSGFAWGRAWTVPLALTTLPILDPAKAREYKLRFESTAKNYLIRHYTEVRDVDYVSCMLTDAYGNFGLLGFALVGIVLGGVLGVSQRRLRGPSNDVEIVVALFLLAHFFQFEQEFVTALFLWVKKTPLLIVVALVHPFVRTGMGLRRSVERT